MSLGGHNQEKKKRENNTDGLDSNINISRIVQAQLNNNIGWLDFRHKPQYHTTYCTISP